MSKLSIIASKLVESGKGILAIDESTGTCKNRFDALDIPFTEEKRRQYRELLVTTPNIEESISGYILFDETIRQSNEVGESFADILKSKGIAVGIKVDQGKVDCPEGENGEHLTIGLDGLDARLKEYKELGAEFAKWRAAIYISDVMPTNTCLDQNMEALADYAVICQKNGIVPIIEPEIVMSGKHTINQCYGASSRALSKLFSKLESKGAELEGLLLKTNMILPGKESGQQVSDEVIAEQTMKCFKENVPTQVAGIVFLSGGQTPKQSADRLNMINKMFGGKPWTISFSYGRGIQQPALNAWADEAKTDEQSQQELQKAAKNCSLASEGKL